MWRSLRFKDLADKKHEIFDDDLQAIVTDRATEQSNERVRFVKMSIASETGEAPRAQYHSNSRWGRKISAGDWRWCGGRCLSKRSKQ